MSKDGMEEWQIGEEVEAAEAEKRAALPSLTEGSIRRGIWILAWPAVLQMSIQNLTGLIDLYFIGQLHQAAALAAVGISNNVGWVIMALMSSVNVGTTALVARFTGARSEKDVHETIVQSILLAVAGSILILLLAVPFLKPLIGLLTKDPSVQPLAVSYLTIILSAVLPFFIFLTSMAIFRGLGDTRTPLMVIVVTTLLKVVGDWVFILILEMGVKGAALASAISQVTGMLLGGVLLLRSPVGHAFRGHWKLKTDWMLRILRIGMPAAVQNVVRSMGSWVYIGILGSAAYATQMQGALYIGLQLEGMAFMPGFGFNIAAATLVGQNLGAKKPDRAERSAWGSAGLGAILMGLIALAFFIFADSLVGLFNAPPLVHQYAVLYLRINAISEPFLALSMVLAGGFEGAGDTVPPTILTLISLWLIRLPLAYLLVLHLGYGATGAWVAMSGSAILQGMMIAVAFKRGRWKHKKV